MIRVVMADDQRVVRDGLALILRLLPGIELLGAAADGVDALALVAAHHPDIALLDLRMPNLDGVEATRRIRQEHPTTQVVILTTYTDDESIRGALHAGARGFLTKDADADRIADALRRVHRGEALLDPAVHARILDQLTSGPAPAASAELPDGLTAREAEVLRLIADGLSNGEIADRLHISAATVKTHVNHLFAKTGARGRAQAVRYAYRKGLAEP